MYFTEKSFGLQNALFEIDHLEDNSFTEEQAASYIFFLMCRADPFPILIQPSISNSKKTFETLTPCWQLTLLDKIVNNQYEFLTPYWLVPTGLFSTWEIYQKRSFKSMQIKTYITNYDYNSALEPQREFLKAAYKSMGIK